MSAAGGCSPPAPGRVPAGRVPVVAIVGGGASGTLVAANLLRGRSWPLRVILIERSGRFGAGVAYATDDPRHLLNVPAERMSAFPGEGSHFREWAASRLGRLAPGAYLPRGLYGEYLRTVLADSRVQAWPLRTLETVGDEAVALRAAHTGLELRLAGGGTLACDRVVLATGPAPASPPAELPSDERVLGDPWRAVPEASGSPSAPTLVLGTGLTAVDVTLSICARGGRVLMLSRGGQLPHVHLPGLRTPAPPPPLPLPQGSLTLAAVECLVCEHIDTARHEGYDWRDAVDGLRPVTQRLWAALAPSERERFLRERRRAWDARRHRMAPAVGAQLHELFTQRRAQRWAGSVLAARPAGAGLEVDVALARSGRVRTLTFASVVACTGAELDVRRDPNPLLAALLDAGLASPDELALGLRATADGALLDARLRADGRVYALGTLRRGELWETTAMEEIRAQAERLARAIERSLGAPALAPVADTRAPVLRTVGNDNQAADVQRSLEARF